MTKCSRNLFKGLGNKIKFNSKKLVVCRSEIPFFSYIVSRDGLKADTKNVESLTQMQPHEKMKNRYPAFLD